MNGLGQRAGELRVGTSGWHYKHWLGTFYPPRLPASQMLRFYAERLDAVELNNTFYRLPTVRATEAWREASPEGFRFAVKGSRFLTHMKKLKDAAVGIERFFERADHLREKMGPVLWQLPPFWEVNTERLDEFLTLLPSWHRYAFEFRHESWNTEAVYQVLRAHGAAYCIFDLAGYQSPVEVTSDAVYVRLHGPGGKYQDSYGDASLAGWAARIHAWRLAGLNVDVYFDNDGAGYAPANALALRERCEELISQTRSE